MRRSTLFFLVFLFLPAVASFSQQDYIARYSAFTAFSYLSTPSLNLTQRGFDGDFGVNVRPWLTIGGDFSYNAGSSSVLPAYLSNSAKAKLAPIIPLLPPGFGAVHSNFEAKPGRGQQPQLQCEAILTQVVTVLVGPSLSKTDTVLFYGFGGGMTWEATHNFGIRVA